MGEDGPEEALAPGDGDELMAWAGEVRPLAPLSFSVDCRRSPPSSGYLKVFGGIGMGSWSSSVVSSDFLRTPFSGGSSDLFRMGATGGRAAAGGGGSGWRSGDFSFSGLILVGLSEQGSVAWGGTAGGALVGDGNELWRMLRGPFSGGGGGGVCLFGGLGGGSLGDCNLWVTTARGGGGGGCGNGMFWISDRWLLLYSLEEVPFVVTEHPPLAGGPPPGMIPVPGTVLIISHLVKSPPLDVLVFEKCDVQFFCFSINSRELNFRSGFSGFSGFSDLSRDWFNILLESSLLIPFATGWCLRFGDGDRSCSDPISDKLSSLLLECDILILNGGGLFTRPSPSFSNSARALLNRAACDSVRTTVAVGDGWLTSSFAGSCGCSTGFR